jgi:hypothetical protein
MQLRTQRLLDVYWRMDMQHQQQELARPLSLFASGIEESLMQIETILTVCPSIRNSVVRVSVIATFARGESARARTSTVRRFESIPIRAYQSCYVDQLWQCDATTSATTECSTANACDCVQRTTCW